MNILDLKAADLGGAIAHVAASQLFLAMTEDEENDFGPRTWFGSDPDDEDGVEKDVLDMARYVNGRDIPAGQLWRWAAMNGIVVNEGRDYPAVPLARRLAFEIFTDTCMRTHHRLELAQLDARKLIPLGDASPAPTLKLEDSIFEQHGSLSDQEAYQKQWLRDQEAADARRLEEEVARQEAASALTQSVGAPIDETETEKPAALSAGQREEKNNAQEAADAGQEAGDTPPADPGAQGSVSELAGDGGAQPDEPAHAGVAPASEGNADAVADPLADAEAGARRVDPVADGVKSGKKSAKGKPAT